MKQPTTRMRVAIIEPDALVRRPLEWLIGHGHPATQLIGAFAEPALLLGSISSLRPEIVTLPAHLQGFTTPALARHLRQHSPAARILIIARSDDARATVDAIRAGAHACVLMDRILDELGQAMHGLARGEQWFCPRAAAWLALAQVGKPESLLRGEALPCPLSARELLVLRERAMHLSYKEIAEVHDISPETARWYANQAKQKLNVASVAEALRVAYRAGWTQLETERSSAQSAVAF